MKNNAYENVKKIILNEGISIRNKFNYFYSQKDFQSELRGTISDGYIPSDFQYSDLYKGTKRELIHTNKLTNAMRIAMDNLLINPDFYNLLEKFVKIQTRQRFKS